MPGDSSSIVLALVTREGGMTQQLATAEPPKRLVPLLVLAGTVVALLWAYWTSLADAARRWSSDPSYSHGYLVPIFAAVLLWLRWNKLAGVKLTPSWWGAP